MPALPRYSPGSRKSKTPVDPRFTMEHLRCSTVEPRFVPVYPGVTKDVYGNVPVTAGCATVTCRCPSLSCPLDSLPPVGQANRSWPAPRGASCPGISCPPPWLSSPPGGKLSRPVYLAPRPTQVKIYTCYFVIFLYHFNEFRSSISYKVRNWCLWG